MSREMGDDNALQRLLASRACGCAVLDGGLATQLEAYGFPLEGANRRLWGAAAIVRDPGLLRAVHLDYLGAGADIIETATYQACFEVRSIGLGLRRRTLTWSHYLGADIRVIETATYQACFEVRRVGLIDHERSYDSLPIVSRPRHALLTLPPSLPPSSLPPAPPILLLREALTAPRADGGEGLAMDEAAGVFRRGVEIAQAAAAEWQRAAQAGTLRPALVAASLGPYGAHLCDGSEYSGRYGAELGAERLAAYHASRLACVSSAEPDLLALESIPCVDEAIALTHLLDADPSGPPAWVSFACRDGGRLNSGEAVEAAVAAAARCPRVVAVGFNCTAPEHIEGLLRRASALTAKPLLCYPNRGEAWDGERGLWAPGTGACDDHFAAFCQPGTQRGRECLAAAAAPPRAQYGRWPPRSTS